MPFLIETRQRGGQWQQSKALHPSLRDADNALDKIASLVRSRRQSGLFSARVIPDTDKRWKANGSEPKVMRFREL